MNDEKNSFRVKMGDLPAGTVIGRWVTGGVKKMVINMQDRSAVLCTATGNIDFAKINFDKYESVELNGVTFVREREEEAKEQQLQELAQFVCGACDMSSCGLFGCADGNHPGKCNISRKVAEAILNAGYHKHEEVER